MTSRRWLVADGYRMHARSVPPTAPASGPHAVLVHGLGVSSRYLLPTAAQLARRRPVTAVDLPGFGRSPAPARMLDIAELAGALGSWLDAAGIEMPLLVANSLGCQVVADLAAGGRAVAGLVLVGPTMDAAARTWVGQATRWVRNSLHEPPSLSAVLLRDYVDCGLRRPAATFGAALDDPIEDRLARITAPVLIVRGEHDPIAPRRWCDELARRTPHATVAEVPGAAHTVNYSHPRRLSRHIEAFVRDRVVGS